MIHATVLITNFVMSLIWAGVWGTALAAGGIALAVLGIGGVFVGVRSAWRRRRSGR